MTTYEQMWFVIGIGGFLIFIEGAIASITKIVAKIFKKPVSEETIKMIAGILICIGSSLFAKSLVVLVHGCGQTFGEKAEDGFTDHGYYAGDGSFFIGGKVAEHVGNNVFLANLSLIRSSNAHPNTNEILTAQFVDDRINAFVPAGAAAVTNTNFSQR
jgi:hypothetical protein